MWAIRETKNILTTMWLWDDRPRVPISRLNKHLTKRGENWLKSGIPIIPNPNDHHHTVLQDDQFAALKEREYYWKFLMILSNFKPKNHYFAIFIRKIVKNSQNWWFWLVEENSKINIFFSLVPQIDHTVGCSTVH